MDKVDEERYDVEAKVTKNITEVGSLGKSGRLHSRLRSPGCSFRLRAWMFVLEITLSRKQAVACVHCGKGSCLLRETTHARQSLGDTSRSVEVEH